jgi:hypothetical protein
MIKFKDDSRPIPAAQTVWGGLDDVRTKARKGWTSWVQPFPNCRVFTTSLIGLLA